MENDHKEENKGDILLLSIWVVMLDSSVSSCWAGSVRILEPCDWPSLVRDRVPKAEVFECGAVIGSRVGGGGGGGNTACD